MSSILIHRYLAVLASAFVLSSPATRSIQKLYRGRAGRRAAGGTRIGQPAGHGGRLDSRIAGQSPDWEAQVASPALQKYRMITYDLRGHGLSGKPAEPQAYSDGRRWADDWPPCQGDGCRTAVLVGWSLGGAVISNYLAA